MELTRRLPGGVRLLVVLVTLGAAGISYAQGESYWIGVGLVAISVPVFFMRLRLTMTSAGFGFRLRGFHCRAYLLRWDKIDKVEVADVSPLGDFLGWGVRYHPKFGWSYVMEDGPALVFTLKDGRKRTFTVGDNDGFVVEVRRRLEEE